MKGKVWMEINKQRFVLLKGDCNHQECGWLIKAGTSRSPAGSAALWASAYGHVRTLGAVASDASRLRSLLGGFANLNSDLQTSTDLNSDTLGRTVSVLLMLLVNRLLPVVMEELWCCSVPRAESAQSCFRASDSL